VAVFLLEIETLIAQILIIECSITNYFKFRAFFPADHVVIVKNKNLQNLVQLDLLFARGASDMELFDHLVIDCAKWIPEHWILENHWMVRVQVNLIYLKVRIVRFCDNKAVLEIGNECISNDANMIW